MHCLSRRMFTALALAPLLAGRARAVPRRYVLDRAASTVGFIFYLSGAAQRGRMPVRSAEIVVDPARLAQSRATVELDVAAARTDLPFAREAMLGPQVLHAARFPTIRFVSTRITLGPDGRISGGARMHGRLTVRDVTRPVLLEAGLYRPPGTAPDDLSVLTIRLRGRISRAAFGATGHADLVGDRVDLDIDATIRAAG